MGVFWVHGVEALQNCHSSHVNIHESFIYMSESLQIGLVRLLNVCVFMRPRHEGSASTLVA